MIQTETRSIDGLTISISQMPAMKALRMSSRLGKLLGAPLAKAISTINTSDLSSVDVAVIGGALASIFDGLTEDALETLTKDLLAAATVDGKPLLPQFDLIFAGKVTTIYKVLGFALEVNYGSFFDVLRALGVSLGAKVTQQSNSDLNSKSSGPVGG